MAEVLQSANDTIFSVWFLMGAALVFFMQAGFAMVETGFTRAKNAGNIIMKNLMDFCIGTVVFSILGFALMMSEDYVMGIFGVPNMKLFTDFSNFPMSSFVFNLVFCATAATIVSGAMAERTKFSAYCIYSGIISLVVYPVEAGWVWNSQGWLAKMGFIDFAGSAAIHSVGGVTALIGAIILGPRIGKYVKDASGKVVKVKAIQGHSLTLGALGCFILWFGWYGFNGAAATTIGSLAAIFVTTTVAPAVATVVTMCYTWIKNGKPDVSMCLNASLAGLVGVTAGCNNVDVLGATIIGIVSGILVVVVIEKLDIKCHVDDPVGAVGVHLANGVWGTIAAGLLSTSTADAGVDGPIYALIHGTSFSEGMKVLGVQCLGIVSILAWTSLCMIPAFLLIKHTIGLRASAEDELAGMDISEHGLVSAYADFASVADFAPTVDDSALAGIKVIGETPMAEAVEVKEVARAASGISYKSPDGKKLTKIEIVCKERMLEPLKSALLDIGITGMTVSHVLGCGIQKGKPEFYRGVEVEPSLLPKIQMDIVVARVPVQAVIDTAKKVLYTGHIGDGKIFVYDVENVIKVRTSEEGFDALQDVE
ncbi:MAG: ammonium transporter [Clostridiales bacterium]|nr:ammonium transporter [Clostridiales bacterium]MBR5040612.1 ammonium transporter [Clostridiales bacterium]